ncbi:DNA-binding GntR family transcriptional regulator [Bradyrhizobium sp. CIR18]|uniref:GntR family transcriptional regulator n=1 Tax=Bradyrhizobium sp. CIR18 TaxID=2663839 RepID=UPI0017F399B7|nr:GntR family transcriptional regulator [Bradyrhizobium sp. CIR18]MBB4365266.1 DNA-binding GntR family transcriptional regulator [Bradyrhizobium sp. CIR18]
MSRINALNPSNVPPKVGSMLVRPSGPPSSTGTLPLYPIDRQTSLGELAYTSLKEAIVGGQFSASQKLTVRAVAQALSISTSPARDAIMRLICEGALVNSGPKTVIVPTLTLAALDELTSIQLVLERFAARVATERIASETVEELRGLQLQISAALDTANYPAAVRANKDFHFLIYKSAQMPQLLSMIESLWLRIAPSLSGVSPNYADSRIGISNHMEAIAGLEDRDEVRVQAAIEKDTHDRHQRLVSCIRRRRKMIA